MKREVGDTASWAFTDRFHVLAALTSRVFYSQDEVSLVRGRVATLEGYQRWRAGYPDIVSRFYFSYGDIRDSNTNKGVIGGLSPPADFAVVPDSYKEVGVGFSAGMESKDTYVRAWRPFIEAGASYNTSLGAGYAAGAGLGGMLMGQDNLSIGASYSVGANNIDEPLVYFYVKYLLMF